MSQLDREPRIARPNQISLVEELRRLAQRPAFNAVCHVFAIRERARQQVTLNSLSLRMLEEGYKHGTKDYAQVLKDLAGLGIGNLEFDPKTKEIRALKNIKLTLQSIGKAAVGDVSKVDGFSPQHSYAALPVRAVPTITPAPEKAPEKSEKKEADYRVKIVALINSKEIEFPLPLALTIKEIGELLAMCFTKK